MEFPLAYLHLSLAISKGEDQVKVTHVSIETGQYSLDFRQKFPEIIKDFWFVVYSSTVSVTLTLTDTITFL